MRALLTWCQQNTSALDIGVQWVGGTNVQAAAKGPGKNDLSLSGDFGLHGKTILPMGSGTQHHISHSPTCWSDGSAQVRIVPRNATQQPRQLLLPLATLQ